MKVKTQKRIFVGDFETSVYKGQTKTEVWASACVELNTEDVHIFHSIDEQFEYFLSLNCNIRCYYHNLKFDGAFWLSYLLSDMHYGQALEYDSHGKPLNFIKRQDMRNRTIAYNISSMGQWYSITIKCNNHYIELYDSLKLLPFSVKEIGESFATKHKKLDMEYEGYRYAGCEITEEERNYIANDVLVVKEALEIMLEQGHTSITIGSCCLKEFKRLTGHQAYKWQFPDLYQIEIPQELYGVSNAGEYIRKSYRGGWCYLAHGKENRIYSSGTTADVNSLYPSMMSSESGNIFPVGVPTFWKGNYIPDEALNSSKFFFIRISTRFYLKKGKLPFIQLKNSVNYKGTEMLRTSDVLGNDGKYYDKYIDIDGNEHDTRITMTMTMTDYKLLIEQYELVDFEILDGCWFNAYSGIFDTYIEKYKKIKLESKGAMRQLAKLFLNNLYGKMAANTNSSFKVAEINDEGVICFTNVEANNKKAGYIPVGSAITSYARNFTIRAAQLNYHGINERGFIYADTDSIHCDLLPDEITGIEEHPKNFCCWKLESCWDTAIFTRQKTYIEHITHRDREPIDKPYYDIKCAGMPDRCKNLLIASLTGEIKEDELKKLTEDQLTFIKTRRNLEDFKVGLIVPGKLLPKRIQGGIVLVDTTYEMR